MDREIKNVIKKELEKGFSYPVDITVSKLRFTYEANVKKVVGKLEKPEKSVVGGTVKRTYKKRKFRRTGQYSLSREYTTSPEDIKVMRTFLGQWHREHIVPETYASFLGKTRGKFSVNFSQNEKYEILNIFNHVRKIYLKLNASSHARENQ